jgi:hypothetical protein
MQPLIPSKEPGAARLLKRPLRGAQSGLPDVTPKMCRSRRRPISMRPCYARHTRAGGTHKPRATASSSSLRRRHNGARRRARRTHPAVSAEPTKPAGNGVSRVWPTRSAPETGKPQRTIRRRRGLRAEGQLCLAMPACRNGGGCESARLRLDNGLIAGATIAAEIRPRTVR